MSEIDYQLALLLQHKFEQEIKQSKEHSSDLQLASELQEQYQRENDIDKPVPGLVYDSSTRTNKTHNTSKCLTDPSWEVIDPTPDIHILFMAFNERFFWNKLLAVCVSWSKRMTSCAGICSYQGRGGMCSITLSEPLLKLRPRKDLVETLLHEMIHAYLFVTNNNKDRDGHGPEFHQHMYRINRDAGTNITVYHSFHDEVRLYLQHWWRCNGPCHTRRPYYGMVRRAVNRAPGPYDNWWAEHSRNCGGTFIKVKEPEKPAKKTNSKKIKKPKEDIRNFIPPLTDNLKENNSLSTKKITNPSIVSGNNTTFGKVHTIVNNNSNSKITTVVPSKVNNIFGFTNLNGNENNSPNGISKNLKTSNNLKTIIDNNKPGILQKSISASINSPPSSFVNKPGRTLNAIAESNKDLDYSVVRNHWVTKFGNSNGNPSGVKRSISQDSYSSPEKIPKLSGSVGSSKVVLPNEDTAECPVCSKKVAFSQLNQHLDICLEMPLEEDTKKCLTCSRRIATSEYEKHIDKCSKENSVMEIFDSPQQTKFIKCSFCEKQILTENYNNHIVSCSKSFVENLDISKSDTIDLTNHDSLEKQCSICEKVLPTMLYDSHVEKCLLQMYDNIEGTYKSVEKVDCVACGKNIEKLELNAHLENCMSLSNIFEDNNEPEEEEMVSKSSNKKENEYNCPCCFKLVQESKMNSHINLCLNIENSSLKTENEAEKDKSIFLESLTGSLASEDFNKFC